MKPTLSKKVSSKPVLKLKPKLHLVHSDEVKPINGHVETSCDCVVASVMQSVKEEPEVMDLGKAAKVVEVLEEKKAQPRQANGRFASKKVAEVQPKQQDLDLEQKTARWVNVEDLNDPKPGGIIRTYDAPGEGRAPMADNGIQGSVGQCCGGFDGVVISAGDKESWQSQAMTLIEDCEHREEKMNDWERIFLDSIKTLVTNDIMLSKKQNQKLNDLWDRVTER